MFGKKAREIKRLRELIRSNDQLFANMQRTVYTLKRVLDVPEGGDIVAFAKSLKIMHEENRTILTGAAQILNRIEEASEAAKASAGTLMLGVSPAKRKRTIKKTKKRK